MRKSPMNAGPRKRGARLRQIGPIGLTPVLFMKAQRIISSLISNKVFVSPQFPSVAFLWSSMATVSLTDTCLIVLCMSSLFWDVTQR
jgi:hypothetical protein